MPVVVGHEVLNPALPDDFDAAVCIAQAEYDRHHVSVVVGSSRGGAVAMNIDSRDTPLVLLCPAWKTWGTATTMNANTTILHSEGDETVPFSDSGKQSSIVFVWRQKMFHYESGNPANPGDSTGITVELSSREVRQWQEKDWNKIQEVERYALIHGLKKEKSQYFVKGAGDLMLDQGTIASLQQKYGSSGGSVG